MTPEAIFKEAEKDGVKLFPGAVGILKARGRHGAIQRWRPIINEHKAEVLAFVEHFTGPAEQADKPEVVSHWWRFYYPNGNLMDAAFCPPASRTEALKGEPDAIRAEAFEPRPPKRQYTPLEEKEEVAILAWLKRIEEDTPLKALNDCRINMEVRDYFIRMAQR
jgi:hypothetical protein